MTIVKYLPSCYVGCDFAHDQKMLHLQICMGAQVIFLLTTWGRVDLSVCSRVQHEILGIILL